MKPQTQRKLEEARDIWKCIAILFIIAFLILSVAGVLIENRLEQQLQTYQEQVPIWTLKMNCYFDWESVDFYNNITVVFDNYEDYSFALTNIDKNCEVIR